MLVRESITIGVSADINEYATGKDIQRIKDLFAKSKGDDAKLLQLAQNMANSIDDPQKAKDRASAAEQILGKTNNGIADIFNQRFKDLQPKAISMAPAPAFQGSVDLDPKDVQRIEDIATQSWNRQEGSASKQAKLIKDADKAYRRYEAAKAYMRDNPKKLSSGVADAFMQRALELGHTGAKDTKKKEDEDWSERRKAYTKAQQDQIRPFAEKIAKLIQNAGINAHISDMHSDGLRISIGNNQYLKDAPYQGYTQGGPEYINNYRKQYLGSDLRKVASIANRFDLGLYKDYNNFFIKIPFGKIR